MKETISVPGKGKSKFLWKKIWDTPLCGWILGGIPGGIPGRLLRRNLVKDTPFLLDSFHLPCILQYAQVFIDLIHMHAQDLSQVFQGTGPSDDCFQDGAFHIGPVGFFLASLLGRCNNFHLQACQR